jgi:hypothetical protein
MIDKLNDADKRMNVESRLLAVLSSYGGQTIVASPAMERLIAEQTDDVYDLAREGFLPPREVGWRPFDYQDKENTAPKDDGLVWIVEEFYTDGVTLGFFDGFTMRTWTGSDDCSVSFWAPIVYPSKPEEITGG